MSEPNFSSPVTNPFGLSNVGSLAAPTFADLDGDGDLDAFVGNDYGDIRYYENTGSSSSPSFAAPLTNPFGLSYLIASAAPTFADIDGDGDLDAFVGNYEGNTLYYENIGSSSSPSFADFSFNPFGLSNVTSYASPTFADIDGDGDLDAFVGNYYGDTHYYQNIGSSTSPSFAAPLTNPFGLSYRGSYASPTLADVDGDGDFDVFVGNNQGEILYYQNTGSSSSPSFTASVTNPFGLSNVGTSATPTFADLDGDGDLDAFVGNLDGDILYFENAPVIANQPPVAVDDSAITNEDTALTGNVLSNDSDPDAADTLTIVAVNGVSGSVGTQITLTSGALLTLNADGSYSYDPNAQFESLNTGETAQDSFIYTVSDGTATQTATVTVTVEGVTDNTAAPPNFLSPLTNPFGFSDVGYVASPTFADIDGDGDLDVFVGNNYGDTFYYENTGSSSSPSFAAPVTNPFGLDNVGYSASPTFADLDGDGDLDAFVGNFKGDTFYYENTGTGSKSSPNFVAPLINPFGLSDVGNVASPTFADLDGDGDLDAFVGNGYGDTFYYENTGSSSSPSFAAPLSNPFGLSDVGYFASLTFADLDGDGDLDAFVGNRDGDTFYYENTGSKSSPSFAAPLTNPFGLDNVGNAASPTLADLDGDGDLDAFVGNYNGDILYFENAPVIANQPPVAVDDSATTNEDTAVSIGVLSNDTDVDGNPLSIDSFTQGNSGTVTLNDNGTPGDTTDDLLVYTPNANFNGTDSFSYTISDGNGGTSTATVNVTVNPVNDAPVAVNNSATTNEDAAVSIGVLSNDTDVDGNPLSIDSFTQGNSGTVTLNDNGTPGDTTDDLLVYTPNANFNGTDSFTYRISDGNGGTSTATVNVTVNPVNDAPVAVNNSATTNEDTAVSIGVLSNDTDVDGNPLSIDSFTQGNSGTVTLNNNGTPGNTTDDLLVYTPNANFNGTDSFTYRISDGNGGTSTATVNVTVNPVNDAPVAVNNSATTNEDTAVSIGVLSNDTDVEGNPLSIDSFTQGNSGTVTLNNNGTPGDTTDDLLVYTPNANFNGTDSFSYTISDGNGGTSTATVNVTVNPVNDAPVAVNNSATTNEDAAVSIGVLSNDTDVEGNPLSIDSFTQGNSGSVTLNNNGTPGNTTDDLLVYTPNANFNGTDSFTYRISDGNGGTSTATVNVTVNPVNDAPVAVNNSATTNEDTAVSIGVLSNDTDVEGDPLSIDSFTQGNSGTVTLNNNGTPGDTTDDLLVYTPNANFNGTDSFSYTISDGNGGTSTATVNVTVNPVNDAPVAVNNSATTNEDTAVSISVLSNDTDVDGNPLSIDSFTQGNSGTVTLNNNGTPGDTTDDLLVYTPNANFNGTDSFTYRISDGNGGTSTATVNVTVNPVNDAPVAVNDSTTTNQNTPVTISVTSLLANDSDVDSSTLSITEVNSLVGGTATLNDNGTPANTSDDFIVFDPANSFTGNGTFSYTLSDGSLSSTATVTVNVIPVTGLNLNGGNEDDTITGGAGDDYINGSNGKDLLYGLAGNDTLMGGNGTDTLYGGAGNDLLSGDDNDSTGSGKDILYGGVGNDTLNGGNGADDLTGGQGNDLLIGGNGADNFIFSIGDGTDTITDFQDGIDKIGLSGGLSFGQLTITASGSNTLVKFGSETLASLTGINSSLITSADFVVI
ncbi:beta strand repeat-containing protein [Gloeothece verrucosa]|uniref:Outer membrane adhesin like protein n=1 Tax=Gloeothece verrucosa (strain PCC 7822) TaxID=497965 RepID=E0UNA2_GLOV7|nr:Ig-like domain-containing protein [Gloeothece verrucosa]ADN18432.1 outer membrane adhesin like protein [Gloeothece verrucosa PCC 7822]